jgi:hypothetical protein
VENCDFFIHRDSGGKVTDIGLADPKLDSFLEQKYQRFIYLPRVDSPAIDKIPPEACTTISEESVLDDEIGNLRPQGTKCDIGAIERKP